MNKIKEYIVPENHIYESFDDMLNGPFKEQAGSLVVLLHDHNEEINKLKKSREVLRKACEFYQKINEIPLTEIIKAYKKQDTFYYIFETFCKKAREAIKQDKEIMEEE